MVPSNPSSYFPFLQFLRRFVVAYNAYKTFGMHPGDAIYDYYGSLLKKHTGNADLTFMGLVSGDFLLPYHIPYFLPISLTFHFSIFCENASSALQVSVASIFLSCKHTFAPLHVIHIHIPPYLFDAVVNLSRGQTEYCHVNTTPDMVSLF